MGREWPWQVKGKILVVSVAHMIRFCRRSYSVWETDLQQPSLLVF